jgi:hypothetical protein
MSVTGLSSNDTNLLPGSLTLTRDKAVDRGYSFHEVVNETTGARSEMYQVPLSGMTMSLTNVVHVQDADGWSAYQATLGPTANSLWRLDAARAEAAEDLPALETVLTAAFEKAGIDTSSGLSMTPEYVAATGEYRIKVGSENPQWQDIEDMFEANQPLTNDVCRIAEQQSSLAGMLVVEHLLKETAGGGQEAINQAWESGGSEDLKSVQSQGNTLRFSDGRLISPAMDEADRLQGSEVSA